MAESFGPSHYSQYRSALSKCCYTTMMWRFVILLDRAEQSTSKVSKGVIVIVPRMITPLHCRDLLFPAWKSASEVSVKAEKHPVSSPMQKQIHQEVFH